MEKDLGNLSFKFFLLNVLFVKESVFEKVKIIIIINKNVIFYF